MERTELCGAIEAILFVAGEPVEEEALRLALEATPMEIEGALDALASRYEFDRCGIRLLRFGRSVQLSTRPEYAPYVEKLLQSDQVTPPRGRSTYIIKDVRLFLNSVDRGLHLMRQAGVDAGWNRQDTDREILLTIRIPKRASGKIDSVSESC